MPSKTKKMEKSIVRMELFALHITSYLKQYEREYEWETHGYMLKNEFQ